MNGHHIIACKSNYADDKNNPPQLTVGVDQSSSKVLIFNQKQKKLDI